MTKFEIEIVFETENKETIDRIMENIKHTLTANSNDKVLFIRVKEKSDRLIR